MSVMTMNLHKYGLEELLEIRVFCVGLHRALAKAKATGESMFGMSNSALFGGGFAFYITAENKVLNASIKADDVVRRKVVEFLREVDIDSMLKLNHSSAVH